MDASNQTQLLLCALRHFGIAVEQRKEQEFLLPGEVQITIEPDGAFYLHRNGQALGRFSDVVRLCTTLQEKAMLENQ
ncbi:MAG: hypothetical protein ACE362_12180 [Phaeodactylibacter xiamenensis]|uniref:Uncharacterized protein n=1 Tax=Phaeodactylibacter xiamenensis TaxID=1524460 RepID=A0A098S2T2_9BACT|nr:hypothetical protein [Phaeodactylibacter xiamenensis]KGE86336.1 hypothetical protein IX84_21270 [Phaeodactylibacter xiamenensis]